MMLKRWVEGTFRSRTNWVFFWESLKHAPLHRALAAPWLVPLACPRTPLLPVCGGGTWLNWWMGCGSLIWLFNLVPLAFLRTPLPVCMCETWFIGMWDMTHWDDGSFILYHWHTLGYLCVCDIHQWRDQWSYPTHTPTHIKSCSRIPLLLCVCRMWTHINDMINDHIQHTHISMSHVPLMPSDTALACVCRMWFINGTWLIDMWVVTQSRCEIRLIHSIYCYMGHDSFIWHDLLICMTFVWLFHMWDVAKWCVGYDSFTMCNMTHSLESLLHRGTWLIHVTSGTWIIHMTCGTWLTEMEDMTHSRCGTWLIHSVNWLICKTRLIHMTLSYVRCG